MVKVIAGINSGQHRKMFEAISSADMGAQNALLLLRACALPRATYALRTAAPILVEQFAGEFDRDVRATLAAVVQRKAPTDGSHVFGPAGDAYRLPLSLGGIGLRSALAMSAAAYVSAVAVAISYMTEEQKVVLKTEGSLVNMGLRMACTKLRSIGVAFLFAPPTAPKQPIVARQCTTTPEFVDHYARISAVGLGMQQLITKSIEKNVYEMLCENSKVKARLLSAGDESGGFTWLSMPPSEPQFKMSNVEVVRALRHRIGIAPIDTLPKCACGDVVTDHNFDHFHACNAVRYAATNERHTVVQHALARVAAEAGVHAHMDYTSSCTKEKDGSRKNPDGRLLGLHSSGADMVIDVAVVTPTADSYVARNPASVTPLRVVAKTEGRKRDKYRDYVTTNQSVFCAFVCESYGAFGKSMRAILAALTRKAEERKAPSAFGITAFSYAQWAGRVLSAAIQRGNSRVVDVAMDLLRQRRGVRVAAAA